MWRVVDCWKGLCHGDCLDMCHVPNTAYNLNNGVIISRPLLHYFVLSLTPIPVNRRGQVMKLMKEE